VPVARLMSPSGAIHNPLRPRVPPLAETLPPCGASVKNRGVTNDVKMPPVIGAAIRFHTSDPVPVAHMIGIRPTSIVATVMNFESSRFAAPSTIVT
jgi:hypothetical protein